MKRVFEIKVRLLIEGDASPEKVIACLGTDMEDAIRRHHNADDCENFGLTDAADLIDWYVETPTLSAGDSLT